MNINEDLAKYNILPEKLAKNLLILIFENFLLKHKYSFADKKKKNIKFLDNYNTTLDNAIQLFYQEIDSISIYESYECYKYLKGEDVEDARLRIGSLSIKDRILLESRYVFVCDMPNSLENNNIFGDKSKKMYICFDTTDSKKPLIWSFHDIPKSSTISDEDLYDYRVGIWESKKLDENLSFDQIRDKLFYTGNDNEHLKYFYDKRKELNGKDTSNIKFITATIDDKGVAQCLFSVVATKDGEDKQELVGNNGEFKKLQNNEYTVEVHFCDFWDIIEDIGLSTPNDFTKKDVEALISLSEDCKISCSCLSFWYQGLSYWLTQDNASLKPCNIQPKRWDKLRPNVKVCKHLEGVCKNLKFYSQQIAMSIKKALKEEGYLI